MRFSWRRALPRLAMWVAVVGQQAADIAAGWPEFPTLSQLVSAVLAAVFAVLLNTLMIQKKKIYGVKLLDNSVNWLTPHRVG